MFADTLKQLRESRGLTQRDLANQLQISKSAISMYENGEREPSFETLEAIADYFNVDMNMLIGNSKEDEIAKLRDELRTRPEMKILFDIARGASREDIEKAVKIIEALKGE